MVTRWRGCVEVRGGRAFFGMMFRSRQRPNKGQINFSHRHCVCENSDLSGFALRDSSVK